MRHRRKFRVGIVGLLAMVVVLLSGCIDIRQEITLKADEQWEAHMLITFPASIVEQMGEEELGNQEESFAQAEEEAKAQGVDAKMEMRREDNGDVVFDITMSGQGWALLNETMFNNAATLSETDGRISLRYDAGEMSSFAEMGGSYVFVLNAGRIHSSNAGEVRGGTATWENPTSPIEAEVSAGGGGGGSVGLIIGLVVAGVVLVAVVVFVLLYLRGRRVSSQPPTEV